MKIVYTHEDRPSDFSAMEREWTYNGLDCLLTLDVAENILPQLDEHTGPTYEFSKALQGPVLEMRCRGVLVDQARKAQVIDQLYDSLERLQDNLERIVLEGVGLPHFNWRSSDDRAAVFYDKLRIPEVLKNGKRTTDRPTREKLYFYLIARPIVEHINALSDIGKKISFLKTGIDPDGRIRTSLNIAGTSTGRFSSSVSEFGTGTNLQNVEEMLRAILIADPGMKFAKFDGQQIQSRIVGAIEWNLFRDGTYLDVCESSDLHTVVAQMCWPELPWTGNLAQDRLIAEKPFYRHYDYRFMCKKLGHGSNFIGKPPTLAAQAKIPLQVVQQFQPKYYGAFPKHLDWHAWVDQEIRKKGFLISLGGRKRWFFGRRSDDSTIRDAVAYDAQETESHIVNNAMLNIWRKSTAIVMLHDHDALTYMYPEEQEDEIIPKLLEQIRYPVQLKHDRVLEIPYEAKVGWNAANYTEANPFGLQKYKLSGDKRKRPKALHILDRSVR